MSPDLLLALFLISFLSNATPFFGASYTLIAAGLLSKSGFTAFNLFEIILITGIGASVSKNVMYAIGIGVKGPLSRNKNSEFLRRIIKNRSFYFALLVLAFIPLLPLDDFMYIGGGAAKASPLKVNLVALVGKVMKSSFEIPLEMAGLGLIGSVTSAIGLGPFRLSLISTLVFLLLGVVLLKIDWEVTEKRVKARFKLRF
ncbi:MAG: hypothetical protein ACP5T2_00775 [Thermoprotei archaeon]